MMSVFVNGVGNFKKDKLVSMMEEVKDTHLSPLKASFSKLIRW